MQGMEIGLGGAMPAPDSDIELKIDFRENESSSARVFEIAAELIRALEDIDNVLVATVDSEISTSLILEDVQKSSLKIFLKNVLKQLDDQALKDLDWKPLVGQYLVKAKYITLRWLDRELAEDQPAGIEDLTAQIEALAKQADFRHVPGYAPINPVRLAQSLDAVQRAKGKFLPGEGLTITLDKTQYVVNLQETWLPSERMGDLRTAQELSNTVDMVLVIRKPDMLGKSQWQFRHGKKNFSSAIKDQEWLDEFYRGHHPLSPGDALRVRVRHDHKYDEAGELIEKSETIIKVLGVIKKEPPPEQLF